MSPGILDISDDGDLQQRAGVQGCENPLLEVGGPSGDVEAGLRGEKGWSICPLLLEASAFIKRGVEEVHKGQAGKCQDCCLVLCLAGTGSA